MAYKNVLLLMADEHSNKVLGCYGHPRVQTPNLDRLAARGTRFANAYTNSPLCVPARTALATGRYVHDTGCWDNAQPYHGETPSWGHALRDRGVPSHAIGKLHYRSAEDDTGFASQTLPMHLAGGGGDLLGSVRDPLPVRHKSRALAEEIGPGESSYTEYDRKITQAAEQWLGHHARQGPWTLMVSWVAPHFPLIAPREFYDLYPAASLPLPKATAPADWPRHPWLDAFRECFITDRFFTDDTRRIALAAYLGLVSFMDSHVGRVLAALEASGVMEDTLVIYTSDHGDNLGARGLWGKSTLYEESAAIPLLIAGRGMPAGVTLNTPVSLVDIHPTLLDAFGAPQLPGTRGTSLLKPLRPNRVAFAEYHAAGAMTGAFMLRHGPYKYVYYAGGLPPQLFNLADDPEELRDLAGQPEQAMRLRELEGTLRHLCDPDAVDRRAKADQAALIARHGGRDAVIARGGFGATPPPGHQAAFASGA